MSTPTVDVVRAIDSAPELRAEGPSDGNLGTVVIRFSTFNTWYEVCSMWEGDFLERTAPGAFAQTIADDATSMRCLFDHGYDPTIGNKVLGPITSLSEDAKSPVGEVSLFDTSYNRDLLPGLKAGVYGSSMRMRVTSDQWDNEPKPSKYNPKGMPERTITGAKVMEFGPVTFPANPDSTAGMRSLTDHFYGQLKQRDAHAYDVAFRAAGMPRVGLPAGPRDTSCEPPTASGTPTDLTGRPDTRSAGGGDNGDEPKETGETPVVTPPPTIEQMQRQDDDDMLRARGILR